MSFQQIILVGNVGNQPEMRYTPSGVAVTNFSIAVNERWTDANGEAQEKTVWFRCAAWRKQAEVCSQYLTKGRQVMVIGKVEDPNIYTDRKGEPRASLEVTVQTVQFLGRRDDADNGTASREPIGSHETVEDMEDIPF